MANANTTKPTKDVLTTLKTKLAALQWTPTGGPAEAAFHHVEIFDMSDLVVALQELLALEGHRVCLIVHDSESFENEVKGRDLHCRQSRQVRLVLADRHWTERQAAMLGDTATPQTTPGALKLKDITLPAVCGLLQDGIRCEPGSGELALLQSSDRADLAGRIVYFQDLTLAGGELKFDLGNKPIV
jgi:hypothetical protein